jgi:hypothetical protein
MRSFVGTALVVAVLAGCSPGRSGPSRERDGSILGGDAGPSGCTSTTDTDGDGIGDQIETSADSDGDGRPNITDDDSDGDGLTDAAEARSTNPCAPANSDGYDVPDFLDVDSDNDGVLDRDEVIGGTDPLAVDTDGDGVSDLAERAAGTSPVDRTDTIPETDFFVVLPYNGDRAMRPLRFGTDIEQADVFFLVDMTGSMRGVRSTIITELTTRIIPGLAAAIPNLEIGAGGYDDYPVGSYGHASLPLTDYMTGRPYTIADRPFYLLREIGPSDEDRGAWSISGASASACPIGTVPGENIGTIGGAANGRPDILEAVEGLPCHGGADGPESTGQALWATATGRGLSWPGGSVPDRTCPTIPDEVGMRRGYPCFRPGSLPIVIVFGDNDFHQGGPSGSTNPYSFAAPTLPESVTALNAIGARVISITNSYGAPPVDYVAVARDTGTVRADGTPIVFEIGTSGDGLSDAVIDAVGTLVGGTPQDVGTITENVEGVNPDNFDATRFIKSIVPLEGYHEGIPGPNPGVSYASKDTTTFYDVIPGTIVEFTVDFWNDVRPPADVAQVFQARIIVVGNGVARLDERRVFIVVPPEGGVVLI